MFDVLIVPAASRKFTKPGTVFSRFAPAKPGVLSVGSDVSCLLAALPRLSGLWAGSVSTFQAKFERDDRTLFCFIFVVFSGVTMTPLVFLDQNLAQRDKGAFLHYLSCLYCLFPNCWFSDRTRMEFVMTLVGTVLVSDLDHKFIYWPSLFACEF